MKTVLTTLLQIFCKIILNFKDIVKSIIVPDTISGEILSINGLNEKPGTHSKIIQ